MRDDKQGKGKKRTGAFKKAVITKLASLSTADLESLKNDLTSQVAVRGSEAVDNIVPEGALQQKLRQTAEGTPAQTGAGLKKALRNAAVAGGGGAAVMGLAQGPKAMPKGLLAGVPAGVQGYLQGKREQQQSEIGAILSDLEGVDNLGVTR